MPQQLYTYEYRKPRINNPTYISNNVSSSLSFYKPPSIQNEMYHRNKPQIHSGRYDNSEPKHQMKESRSDFSLPKINSNKNEQLLNLSLHNIETKRDNHTNLGQYGQNVLGSTNQFNNSLGNTQNLNKRASSIGQLLQKNQKSILSQEKGSFVNLNEKDIFIKQGHNYNIITYQPKEYNEHIKKYPKLSLQQKDQYFRLKYINNPQYNNQSLPNPEHSNLQPTTHNQKLFTKPQEKIAGMHTYRVDHNNRNRRNDVNEDELVERREVLERGLNGFNTKSSSEKGKPNPRATRFDMKLLNNMDQFNYYA